MSDAETVHASCVALSAGGALHGVLIFGRSGAGKSDLTLRLIDRGAQLVSDDYTRVERRGGALFASPPPRIAGQIEVRGIGIVEWPHIAGAEVGLAIDLDAPVVRMPDAPAQRSVAGTRLPTVALTSFEASAPIKAELAVRQWWRSMG